MKNYRATRLGAPSPSPSPNRPAPETIPGAPPAPSRPEKDPDDPFRKPDWNPGEDPTVKPKAGIRRRFKREDVEYLTCPDCKHEGTTTEFKNSGDKDFYKQCPSCGAMFNPEAEEDNTAGTFEIKGNVNEPIEPVASPKEESMEYTEERKRVVRSIVESDMSEDQKVEEMQQLSGMCKCKHYKIDHCPDCKQCQCKDFVQEEYY